MNSLLTFRRGRTRYAIEAETVLEVVEMPALSGWPAAPAGVAGVIDYRGEILPVIDIAVRVGQEEQTAPPEDAQLVLLQTSSGKLALWVDEAMDLVAESHLRALPEKASSSLGKAHPFLAGVLSGGEQVILKLDLAALAEFEDDTVPARSHCLPPSGYPILLNERARELARPALDADDRELGYLVVLRLEGERFGISVDEVAELTRTPPWTPVPGGPSHLLGLAYHRGELLRVVDIRSLCGLTVSDRVPERMVILSGPGMPTGVLFDRIEAVAGFAGQGDRLSFEGDWLTVLDTEQLDLREPTGRSEEGWVVRPGSE